jgi:hypothetical protein
MRRRRAGQIRHFFERIFLRVDTRIARHKRYLRLAFSAAGLLAALLASNLFEFILKNLHLTQHAAALIQYAIILLLIGFVGQSIYLILEIAFGADPKMPAPPSSDREVKLIARPYQADSSQLRPSERISLGSLTHVAEAEFEGDTMRKEVVQAAVQNRCALGLKIKDPTGRDVGFFDIYHLKPEVMSRWLSGSVYERDLTPDDFEPIDVIRQRGDATIEFFVGAILLKHRNPVYNFYFGPLLATASLSYLHHELRQFRKVKIYASIFSEAGRRYADLFRFLPDIPGGQRGAAGGGHDIYSVSFVPGSQERTYLAHSLHNIYSLEVKMDE